MSYKDYRNAMKYTSKNFESLCISINTDNLEHLGVFFVK